MVSQCRSPEHAQTDSQSLQRVLGGDRAAFEALYEKYVKRIYGLVFRMVGSAQEAEEVTQEVFCQVYRALPNFRGSSQFYTWIYRIATNVSLQHVKKQIRQRRETRFDDAIEYTAPTGYAGSGDPHAAVEARAFYSALETSIGRLPSNQRLVMILGPIQGHSYEQMADITGTSAEVIKGRLHRARVNLRADLKGCR